MPEQHTVSTRFTLDDHAHEALEHLKEGFEHLHERVEKTQEAASEFGSELLGIGKNAIGTALGLEMTGLIEGFKSAGEEIFEAAGGLEEQEKAIRGILMITDKEGTSLEEMSKQAHELGEEFGSMASETGASKSSIVSAFDEMAERTGLATDDVKKLTEEMAEAGRAVPGGIDSLATGFSNLSAGMIKAKNPIVQLISATGLLKGNAKQVAEQMKKMGPEQAMNLGIKAVEKMGIKMKDVPLSFNETVSSLKNMREELYETVGTPMIGALGSSFGELRGYFKDNREEIQKWAKEAGEKAGELMKEAGSEFKKGFQYLEAHSAEIKADIMEAMHDVKATVQFLIDHREAIAIAWGASKVPGMIGAASGVAGGVMGAVKGAAGVAGGFGTMLASTSFGGAAAGEGVVAAEGAAAAGAAAVAKSAVAAEAGAVAAGEGATAAAAASVKVGTAGVTVATGAGASVIALGAFAAAIGGVTAAVWQGSKLWTDAVTHNGQVLEMQARKREAERAALAGETEEVELMTKALYNAGQATDAYIANIKAQGEAVRWATDSKYRKESMIDPDARAADRERAEIQESLAYKKAHPNEGGEIKVPPQLNFTGPITIHQDFKNTDPDRMAIMFKKELGKSALAKTTAATQVAHTAF